MTHTDYVVMRAARDLLMLLLDDWRGKHTSLDVENGASDAPSAEDEEYVHRLEGAADVLHSRLLKAKAESAADDAQRAADRVAPESVRAAEDKRFDAIFS